LLTAGRVGVFPHADSTPRILCPVSPMRSPFCASSSLVNVSVRFSPSFRWSFLLLSSAVVLSFLDHYEKEFDSLPGVERDSHTPCAGNTRLSEMPGLLPCTLSAVMGDWISLFLPSSLGNIMNLDASSFELQVSRHVARHPLLNSVDMLF